MIARRRFLATAPAAALAVARMARAQETSAPQGGAAVAQPEVPGASMTGDGYVPVTRPPKPGATPSMTPLERDERVEKKLSCPCPCTLDVFTCRTSMPCGFSPRMHQDVVRLVEGGYSAQEIIDAFEVAYGERVLMAPKKEGFNLVGWGMPFAVLLGGGTALTLLLRSWHRRAQVRAARVAAAPYRAPAGTDATPEEIARLEAAVRGEDA